jgi:hypothetical protein
MGDTLAVGVPFLVLLGFAVKLAWYAGVIVLLFRIWLKVKHLPG